MLCADVRAPAHTHHTSMPERNHIDEYSFHGHVPSKPVPDGLLPVHPPSFLVLRECGQGRVIVALVLGCSSPATLTVQPATLRASTLMMRKYTELVTRPSTEVIITNAPAGHVPLHAPRGPACDRTFAFAPLAAVAHSSTPAVEEAHHEARQKGNRNPGGGEGTWGTTAGREQVWGPGLGSLLTTRSIGCYGCIFHLPSGLRLKT